jgi:excisionase family DNA binding protein
MKEKDKLMTVSEVFHYLKTSRRTLYRLIERGRLPAIKVGGQWRFRRGEVDKYLMAEVQSQPRFFKIEVLEKYRAEPTKYEIRLERDGGWLSMKESYLSIAPEARKEFFQMLRFTKVRFNDGTEALRIMPESIKQLPNREQMRWTRYEVY